MIEIIHISNAMREDVFFRHYANLPIPARKEVVLDLGEETGPITWEVAYREIKAQTKLGKEIFEKLIKLGFIPNENAKEGS